MHTFYSHLFVMIILLFATVTVESLHPAAYVNAHNAKRCLHGSPPVTWSASVAAAAQAYTNGCNFLDYSTGGYGQNLYRIRGTQPQASQVLHL